MIRTKVFVLFALVWAASVAVAMAQNCGCDKRCGAMCCKHRYGMPERFSAPRPRSYAAAAPVIAPIVETVPFASAPVLLTQSYNVSAFRLQAATLNTGQAKGFGASADTTEERLERLETTVKALQTAVEQHGHLLQAIVDRMPADKD